VVVIEFYLTIPNILFSSEVHEYGDGNPN